MTLRLTEKTENAVAKTKIEPQLVLKIEGVDTLFGAVPILRLIQIGDPGLEIGDDWVIGGVTTVEDQEDIISLEGTGSKIDQQIRPDLGSVSSISSIAVALIDADEVVTRLISPGVVVDDIMGKKAKLYLGMRSTGWPEDYIEIFGGIIDDVDSGAGKVVLNLAHPEQKKRTEIFPKVATRLAARTAVFTVTIASPGVFSSVGHNLQNDQAVRLTTTGSLPSPLVPTTTIYYVVNRAADTFQLSTSVGGAAINTSGSQSGVHTFHTGINDVENTSITLEDASMLVQQVNGPNGSPDEDTIKHYIRIDDEIIRYTTVTGNVLTGIERFRLDTTAVSHLEGADVVSFYTLDGLAVDLALKLMLSGVNGYYVTGVEVESINQVSADLNVPNALFFAGVDVADEYGVVEGDYVTLAGSTGNDFTLKQITQIEELNGGSYIVLDGVTLTDELTTAGTVSLRSQYDTLGEGLGLHPDQVDVEEHLFWDNLQLSAYNFHFYLKETVKGKEFIDKQIYAPIGAFSIPRKGRCSLGYHIGPIARTEVKTLDKTNIREPSKIHMRRTINKNFYNSVVYKYDEAVLEDKFLGGTIVIDADSVERIPVGKKPLTFEASGLRSDDDASGIASRAGERILKRYRFGAEHFENIKVFFKAGFNIEPGDIVLFDPTDLKISNTIDGNRKKAPKFFEVTNKSFDFKTGDVVLAITDTSFETDERYGVISPSSVITGGTTTILEIEDSFGGVFPGNESRKWRDYVGLPILVHSEDFSFSEQVTLLQLDPADPYKLYIDPSTPLSMAPTAGWIIDVPPYPDSTDRDENRLYKLFHCFLSPQVDVVSGASDTEFDVDPGDVDKFFEGAIVKLHSEDFSTVSDEVRVLSIAGDTITVDASLGFTPDNTIKISFIGFADEDPAYRWI